MAYARAVAREHLAWALNNNIPIRAVVLAVGRPDLAAKPFHQIELALAILWMQTAVRPAEDELSKVA